MESWELDLPDFEVPTFESPKAKKDASSKQQGRRRSLRLLKRQSTDVGGESPGVGLGTYYDDSAVIVPAKVQRRRSTNRRSRAAAPLDPPITDLENEISEQADRSETVSVLQSIYDDGEDTENTDTNQCTEPILSRGRKVNGGKSGRRPKARGKKKSCKNLDSRPSEEELETRTDSFSSELLHLQTDKTDVENNPIQESIDIEQPVLRNDWESENVEKDHQDSHCDGETAPAAHPSSELNISDLGTALETVNLSSNKDMVLPDEFSDLELPFCEEEDQKYEKKAKKESRRSKRRSSDFYVMEPTYSVEEELNDIDMIDSVEEEMETCRKSKRLKRKSIEIFRQSSTPKKDEWDEDDLDTAEETSKICSSDDQDMESLPQKESMDVLDEWDSNNLKSQMSSKCPKEAKGKQTRKRKSSEPSVEEIYLNKNFSMPPAKVWETIFENPLKNKAGVELMTSLKKMRRSIQFSEFAAPPSKTKSRHKKALGMGWKPPTKKSLEKIEKLLESKLAALDASLQRSPYNTVHEEIVPMQEEDFSSLDSDVDSTLAALATSVSRMSDVFLADDEEKFASLDSLVETKEPSNNESDTEEDDSANICEDNNRKNLGGSNVVNDEIDSNDSALFENTNSISHEAGRAGAGMIHMDSPLEELPEDEMISEKAEETYGTANAIATVPTNEQDQDDVFFTPMKWAPLGAKPPNESHKSTVSSLSDTDLTFRTCRSETISATETDYEVFKTPKAESRCNVNHSADSLEQSDISEQSENSTSFQGDVDSIDSSDHYNLDTSNNSLNTAMMMLLNSSKETSSSETDDSESTLSSLQSPRDVFSMSGVGDALLSDGDEEENALLEESSANSSSFSDYDSPGELYRASLLLDVPPCASVEKKNACILARSLQLLSYRKLEESRSPVSESSRSTQHVHWSNRPVQMILYDDSIQCSSLDDTLLYPVPEAPQTKSSDGENILGPSLNSWEL
ncbi:uncharacterized protein LOC106170237 [Lingula anatina]|uniref:Uncharacterized protein LOC106170237 n=1 Tax=Lingula anatina TaxID=7574 RepID=A0A1S3J525_LINAN|nr:uncharacterized protein LOC106170237 [Lingula anatina]|eukprot:XP_013405485.1 uncharacterized protein LOC106170237 [Lingula anatina]